MASSGQQRIVRGNHPKPQWTGAVHLGQRQVGFDDRRAISTVADTHRPASGIAPDRCAKRPADTILHLYAADRRGSRPNRNRRYQPLIDPGKIAVNGSDGATRGRIVIGIQQNLVVGRDGLRPCRGRKEKANPAAIPGVLIYKDFFV